MVASKLESGFQAVSGRGIVTQSYSGFEAEVLVSSKDTGVIQQMHSHSVMWSCVVHCFHVCVRLLKDGLRSSSVTIKQLSWYQLKSHK